MQFYDKRTSFLLLIFALPLLFIPKINLISFGGAETAGIRIDDMILLILLPILLWGRLSVNKEMHGIEKSMFALLCLSLISYAANRYFFYEGQIPVEAKIYYALRLFEYFLFFYLGILTAPLINFRTLILLLFAFNGVIMVAQKLELIGQFTNYGYIKDGSSRIVGLSSFPSEAGAYLNLLFCYLLFSGDNKKYDTFWSFILFFVTSILTLITGSRIALAAMIVIFTAKYFMIVRRSSLIVIMLSLGFVTLIGSVITYGILKDSNLYERSAGLVSWKNFELAKEVWNSIDTHYDPTGYEVVDHDDEKYDMSWWIRIHKWCYILKLYIENPQCWLQGLGPGVATAAIDGGFIRILVEYGIAGFIVFISLFRNLARQSQQLYWMVAAFLVNMIFFDVHLAYKVMSLLFLTAGATARTKSIITEATSHSLPITGNNSKLI